MNPVLTLQHLIDCSHRIVFFGGAGISTESGIPDFRSSSGLYNRSSDPSPETILSHDFMMAYPERFFDFYRSRMIFPNALPNAAHLKLAEMEARGKLFAVITQNIDGLHQAAGSKNVLELHGSVHRNYCVQCNQNYPLETILKSEGIPTCPCGGMIRPRVVLYGEQLNPDILDDSIAAIQGCDLMIVGGTSLVVYPAAGLRHYCKSPIVLINRNETDLDRHTQLTIHGSLGEVLGGIVIE